ncbi:MAG: polysaccharide biosynthesis tyrosine autokinase [Aphanocapsa sp. GSE-SYN-MK-11-07L]|nr:polysaccharide biosynthesis tyrosine autokinase [Aphanocapsa sp. GSE-SYN-MK-11-07L]
MENQSPIKHREYIEEIDPQGYWLVLKRRWLPATAVLILFASAAVYVSFSKKPGYEAEGKLLFQRSNPTSALTGVGQEFNALDVQTGGKDSPLASYLQTQAEVLKSSPLLQETISALNIRNAAGELIAPEDFVRPLSVKSVPGTDVLQIGYKSQDPKLAANVVNYLMSAYLKSNISGNRGDATSAKAFINVQLPQAELALRKAAEALSQFKERYRIASLEPEMDAAVDLMKTADEQVQLTESELASFTAQSNELQQQLGLSPSQAIKLSTLSQTPGVQNALTELQKVEYQLAGQSELYTDKSPIIVDLKGQADNLRAILRNRIQQVVGSSAVAPGDLQIGGLKQQLAENLATAEASRLAAQKQLQALQRSRQDYSRRLNRFPELEKNQQLLEQRLKAAQTNYETLLAKSKETELAENQDVGNARILEKAFEPTKALGSGNLRLLAAGLVVGALMGVATAFLLDILDKSIKTVKDAEALFGFKLLGVVPQFKSPDKKALKMLSSYVDQFSTRIITLHDPQSPVGAAYEILQANLRFLRSDKKLRAIVVTSSVPGEGKSEVAANLAASLAQSGRRVLLVDADLRNPSQHRLWNLTDPIGFSHVLFGAGDLKHSFKQVLPNLTVLAAGVMPPNPLALIDSDAMFTVIDSFLQEYEYVIIDTPPLQGAVDAIVLGKAADGILMVVRPRLVTSAEAITAKTMLATSDSQILGLVANAVDTDSQHQEHKSYGRLRPYPYGLKVPLNEPVVDDPNLDLLLNKMNRK